jgi:2-hydroxychromene-2-carboxylate isomerase
MNRTPPGIRFYFDYLSPNAYLAWTQLPALAKRHGVAIEPVPVLFAGLLEAYGQVGPAEVPPKIRWMSKSNLRKAALLGVELNPPAFHPFNPLLALRVSSLPLAAAERSALIDAIFRAVWVRGLHVSEPPMVEQLAEEIGLSGAAFVAEAQGSAVKARLRKQTDDAVARGIFGVPSMEVGDELFWGFDDFPHLELYLSGKDPIDPIQWEKWPVAPRASAVRARKRQDPSAGKLPDLGRQIAPLIQGLPRAVQAPLMARLERTAAERYRVWSASSTDPAEAEGLRACALREDEVATRVESIFPAQYDDERLLGDSLPRIASAYRTALADRPIAEQYAIQAAAERRGASFWRILAASLTDPAVRDGLLACAGLEERSAEFLEALVKRSA